MKPMPANLRGIAVDGEPKTLEGVRDRLQAICHAAGTIQGVYTWWKPDRIAEDGTVQEDGGPVSVVAISRDGSTLRAHVVALCNTRATADAVAQYAQEFFWLRSRPVAGQSG